MFQKSPTTIFLSFLPTATVQELSSTKPSFVQALIYDPSRELLFSHCKLSLHFPHRVLDVSHNELTTPGSNAWQVMPFLRDVRLQGNYVRSLTNSTFAPLSRLEVLDARDFPLHVFQVSERAVNGRCSFRSV